MDKAIKKKMITPKKIAAVAGGAFIVFLFIYAFVFRDSRSKLNVERDKITIATVVKGPFKEFVPQTGTVVPITTHYLTAEEGGRVIEKYIEEGTHVELAQPIIKLENTTLLMDIMYREAELFRQIDNLRGTRLQMERNRLEIQGALILLDYQIIEQKRQKDRYQTLWDKNLESKEMFDQAKNQYEYSLKRRALTLETFNKDSVFRELQVKQLETSVARMQENLKIVKQKQDNLTLRAPIKGHLTSLQAEIGESKNRGQPLGQIDVLDGFKIRVGVDEFYIARINKGQKGEFEFAGKTYFLIVNRIYPQVIEGRFQVDMLFEGQEAVGIRRGMTVHVRIDLSDLSEEVLLAKGGFYQKTGGQWVYVLDESEGFAVKRSIKIGRQNSQYYTISDGLELGDKVIVSSYESYGDIDMLMLN
jgi:HlyD family secretion protein